MTHHPVGIGVQKLHAIESQFARLGEDENARARALEHGAGLGEEGVGQACFEPGAVAGVEVVWEEGA